MTLLRSLIVGGVAVVIARPLCALLADGRPRVRHIAWALLLAPYFMPLLITGYAYASFSLSLIHHPVINTILYSALLCGKYTPLAAVILYFTPAPISKEAVHCWRLAQEKGSAVEGRDSSFPKPGNIQQSISNIEHPITRLFSPGPHPGPLPSDARGRSCSSVGMESPVLANHLAAVGALTPADNRASAQENIEHRTSKAEGRTKVNEWAFLLRAGCARGPVAAFAVVFLFAFAEFEMASLMGVKSWTVSLFDAHAGGLALGASLRRMVGPLLCEVAAVGMAVAVLGRHRGVIPARRVAAKAHWLAWVYLASAFVLVQAIPVGMVLWGTVRGFKLLFENFVLSHEIVSSLLFASAATVVASLAAAFGQRLGKPILMVAMCLGLLGPLVLSLAVLAAVQLPGLISLRDTPLPLVLTLGLVLLPFALVLKRVLELTGYRSALHLARLMEKSRPARELTWRLSTSGKFWALLVLFVWAYWDLTASAILAPVGMTPVTVRLYNLMHYGQIAALSALTCATFAAPILIFLLAWGTRRWWAPR